MTDVHAESADWLFGIVQQTASSNRTSVSEPLQVNVWEEEPYFLKLVSYIQLILLRAGLVSSLEKLDRYPRIGFPSRSGVAEAMQVLEQACHETGISLTMVKSGSRHRECTQPRR
jgi:hypothetical protein